MSEKLYRVVGRDSNGHPIVKGGRRVYVHTGQAADGTHSWRWYRKHHGRMLLTTEGIRLPGETYEMMKRLADRMAEAAEQKPVWSTEVQL
jgi:hypothetical protein